MEQALLEAGRSAGASPHTRARALAALGLAAGPLVVAAAPTQAAGVIAAASEAAPVPVVTATTATVATKIGLTTTLAKVVAGITLAGAVAAVPLGTMVWQRLNASASAASTTQAIAAAPGAERAAEMPVAPRPTEIIVKGDTTSPTTSAKSLSRELAALDTARLRLAKGDVSGAMAVLDDYGRKFPQGRLAMEAEVLQMDALARSGRTQAARSRAVAFLRNHPDSVLGSRVRNYLGAIGAVGAIGN